jgi:hypothetical protein
MDTAVPAPCPPGSFSDAGAKDCRVGSRSVILYDWLLGITWAAMTGTVLAFYGRYKHNMLSPPKNKNDKEGHEKSKVLHVIIESEQS